MREVAGSVSSVAAALPTASVASLLEVLDLATAQGLLDDPRWDLLPQAA
jgi:hypothetical protein